MKNNFSRFFMLLGYLLIHVPSVVCQVQRFDDGVLNYTVISTYEKTCKVSGLVDFLYDGFVTVPEEINGYTVVEIGGSFQMSDISGIDIPSTVKSIARAFPYCRNLTVVRLSEGVEDIEQAFSDCTSLSSINIPSSVKEIGYDTFRSCESLSEVKLEDGLERIGDSAFGGCKKITKIDLPSTIVRIGSGAFNRTGLKHITIPDKVEAVLSSTFSGCTSLEEISLPSGIRSIGSLAFYNCTSLKEIELPEGVATIGQQAFYGCKSLSRLSLPSTITSLGVESLSYCSSLTELELPQSLQVIEEGGLSYCPLLTSLKFPRGMVRVGRYAFYGCDGIECVISEAREPFSLDEKSFEPKAYNALLTIPAGTKQAYAEAEVWSNFSRVEEKYFPYIIAPSEVSVVDGGCVSIPVEICGTPDDEEQYKIIFSSYDTTVAAVTNDNRIQANRVGETLLMACFIYEGSLYSTLIKLNVVGAPFNQGGLIFDFVSRDDRTCKLVGISEPASLPDTLIIPSFVLGDTVVEIESVGNLGNPVVKEIVIPSSIKYIRNGALGVSANTIFFEDTQDAIMWEGNIFSNYVKDIYMGRNWSFSEKECQSCWPEMMTVRSVTLGSLVDVIPPYAFANYDSELFVEGNIKIVGDHAFDGFSSSDAITVPPSVESIGAYAYKGCEFERLELPSSLTSIGEGAFEDCGISEVRAEWESPIEASANIFDQAVYSDVVLYVPIGRKEEYAAVMPWCLFLSIDDGITTSSGLHIGIGDTDVKIFNSQGVLLYNGPKEEALLTPGVYIIESPMGAEKIYIP